MQTPGQSTDAQMGIVLIVAFNAAIIDWRYQRQGGKKPTAKDRWLFCAVSGVSLLCLVILDLMGLMSAEIIGKTVPTIFVMLFALWELGRWRVRRKNPIVKTAP
jgi:hypothetical protein